jgi:thiamine-monophosphate kinase
MRELGFIEWVRARSRFDATAVPVGPGDDCAVVALGGERLLLTCDQVLEGTHFLLDRDGPRAAGRKGMARNLSDVAAMAAVPVAAVATVALPKGFASAGVKAIYNGLRAVGDEFGCPLVGGDVGSWSGPLALSVTIAARPGPAGVVLRSGARAGDAICVTGRLGGAWRTKRHLRFTPRIAEALLLAERYGLHAMIDLSDGMATDLGHLCRASGVAAEVEAAAVPVHADARRTSKDPLMAALSDGEDYELLFALAPQDAERLVREQPLGVCVTRVGTVLSQSRSAAKHAGIERRNRREEPRARNGLITLVRPGGRRGPLTARGWEHTT